MTFPKITKALVLTAIICLSGVFNQLQATHFIGISPWIECLGTCTYRLHWYEYRECTVAPFGTPTPNWVGQGGGCTAPVPIGTWSLPVAVEVTPIAPGVPTNCTLPGAGVYGLEEIYVFRDYDFCAASCTVYNMTWGSCCRNAAITSLTNPGTQGYYVGNETVDLSISPCNSSPHFDEIPVIQICQGSSETFNMGATDLEGDSLVYTIGICYSAAGVPLSYNPGYTPTTPLGSSWAITLDPHTGIMQFNAQPGNLVSGPICIYVEEYRNGVKIGEIIREMNVYAIPCTCAVDSLPAITGITNLQGGTLSGNDTVFVYAGSNLCFDLLTDDIDNFGNDHTLTWDQNIPGATFTDTTGTVADTIVATDPIGRFCWTPITAGTYRFTARVRDPYCIANAYAVDELTITLIVQDTSLVWPGDADNNLVANYIDFLALGIAYGSTGPVRPGANLTWIGQAASDWVGALGNGVNFKFADCNGDGTVDANDTTAVLLNYGLTHNKTGALQGATAMVGLQVVIPPDTVNIGDTVHAPIYLGDMSFPANDVYGIGFSLSYDPALIDSGSVKIDFDGSWLGQGGTPLSFDLDFFQQGHIDAAHVRTDQTNVSGYGQIGTLHFIITDNIDGKRMSTETLHFAVTNLRLVDIAFQTQPVAGIGDTVIILDPLASVGNQLPETLPAIYPNPGKDLIKVVWPRKKGFSLELFDLQGVSVQTVYAESSDAVTLNLADLARGLYLIRISQGNKVVSRKIFLK